jgi:hypothetical protein
MRTWYHAVALALMFGADVDQDRAADDGVARLLRSESSELRRAASTNSLIVVRVASSAIDRFTVSHERRADGLRRGLPVP